MQNSRSIYNLIKSSNQTDSYGNNYPDFLTLPLNKFVYKYTPTQVIITQNNINRFDLFIYSYYGTVDYQDIILFLNGINSIHSLIAGQTLNLPNIIDLTNFYVKNII
jgi:hypothetical protein